MKLEDCNYELQQRIKRQIAQEDAAKIVRQPVAGLGKPEPQHREVQTLADRPPQQKRRPQSPRCLHVLIVRYGRKRLDDDNLVSSYKALRDALAEKIGIDDGDRRVEWDYDQVQTTGATGTQILLTKL